MRSADTPGRTLSRTLFVELDEDHSGALDIDEIENHSFDGFIEKPIELEEFKQLVKEDE